MNSLLYLAEDATGDAGSRSSYTKVASAVIKDMFRPSERHSINEQTGVFFNAIGWKNAQIKLLSSDKASIVLGSNRYLDQNQNTKKGLELLVTTVATAVGYHILGRNASSIVDVDVNVPIYNIELHALSTIEEEIAKKPAKKEVKKEVSRPSQPKAKPAPQSMPSFAAADGDFDTSQIFLPILSPRIPLVQLSRMLRDVLVEFSSSWYGHNPIENNESEEERKNLVTLISFLTSKASETGTSWVDLGKQVGGYYSKAITSKLPDEDDLILPEIIEGSDVGSIIRDIDARSLCTLTMGETCRSKIGSSERHFCDFTMGLWEGLLGNLLPYSYKFTGFYATGKRSDDPCLMEFDTTKK